MKIRCLRVASLPTCKSPGAGLATLELAEAEELDTILLATISRNELIPGTDLSVFSNVVFLKPSYEQLFLSRLILVVRLSFFLAYFSARRRFSVLHCHSLLAAPFCLIFSMLTRARSVYTFHGSDFHTVIHSSLYLRIILFFDVILFVSKADLAQFREILLQKSIFQDRLYAVGNGFTAINTDFSRIRSGQSGKFNVIVLGRLESVKNPHLCLQLLSESEFMRETFNFFFVGEGSLRASLIYQINALGLTESIELLGVLSREEVFRQLDKSDIIFIPSRNEAIPKALLEGMSQGCIPIASDVGDCASIIGRNDLVFNADSLSGAEECFLKVASFNEVERNHLTEYLKVRVQKYSWDNYRAKHQKIYKCLAL